MIEFDVKIDADDLYNYMMAHAYGSAVGLIGSCFGALMVVIFGMDPRQWIFLVFGVILLLYLPVNLRLRSKQIALTNPSFQQPLHYVLDEEGIAVSQGETTERQAWADLYRATATGRSVIVYTTKVSAAIFPNRDLGDQRTAVVEMISTHMPPRKVKIRS
ncbi:MAG: YcxB family protein [Lachnospiraceae bacterium]|nr:YcxB family protein [Lachnospiraceae bacterium]